MNEGKPGPSGEEPAASPGGPDGDFELARPDRERAVAGDDHEGDYELDRPLRPESDPGEPLAPDASGAAAGGDDARTESAPDVPPPAAAFAPPAHGQQRPLHDPDPYSTPPYGEPGPWAPAPPVQHPAATPAHGIHTQQAPQDTTPFGAGTPQSTAAAPHDTATHPGAAPAPQPVGAPTQHGAPPSAPAPQNAPPFGVPAPQGASTAPHDTAAQHDAPPSAPAAQDTAPFGAPAPAAPHEAAARQDAGTFGGSGGSGGVPGDGVTVAAIPAQAHPGAQDASAADPWGRYDPWAAAAAAAPLQHAGPAVVSEKQKRRRARRVLIGAALTLALVSGVIGGAVGVYLERNGGVGTVKLPQAGKEASGRDPGSVAGIAAQALPSVVTLHVSGSGEAGTGTGFVLDGRGHILTNNHVVEPAGDNGDITVTFNSGDTAEATVVGRDSGYDLAVVKVKGVSGLTPLPLGNSDNVRVGDPVVAIGAPFDLAGTVTSGIISARERPITAGGEKGDGSDVSYVDALQTDAPINPGNSGGPLLDARARVVGINSAIRSADGAATPDGGQSGSIGLGFAIPINQGKRVAEELINTGKAVHPVIGITLDMDYSGDGARVAAKGGDGGPPVSTGGPGARAGIKAGDVITEVDGRRVHSGEELIVKTRAHRPGDRLELTLERDGEERTVTLTLGSSGGG
ncbi:trypsin-like peptidase domain-containing protein [Streptomyces sp. NA02536]|uniref:trypsin-like peptidase domain-containing protein n=1 Tax=Streptomyces sp. NA02536 TaxID=2742133 RepID=UPI0020CB49CD|nr:trypsin-like peptidase domain-containing protein [Streptomyces sp. NA02536]